MPGIEPGASYMQSMRSTTELHPLRLLVKSIGIYGFLHFVRVPGARRLCPFKQVSPDRSEARRLGPAPVEARLGTDRRRGPSDVSI